LVFTLNEYQDALENSMDDVVAKYIDYMQAELDHYYAIDRDRRADYMAQQFY